MPNRKEEGAANPVNRRTKQEQRQLADYIEPEGESPKGNPDSDK
jgi:hypothetical protein